MIKKATDIPRGSLDILEEAVHLLRQTPFRIFLLYCIGTFPFLLAFLYFWADMSRGPLAHRYVPEAALAVSLFYIWMKCWQSVFSVRLYSILMGQPAEPFSLRRIVRLAVTHTILQPYGLFLLPLAFLLFLPFGWTFAFFQNLLVIGSGQHTDLRRIITKSWRLASLWPAQNHRLLLILVLFTFVVFINVGAAIVIAPSLLKTIFGIETVFTLSGIHVLNTTLLSVIAALTYLCIDPLVVVIYTLRCFYGDSIETGADLIADLKKLPKAS